MSQQSDLLHQSFEIVKQNAYRFSTRFYEILLTDHPAVRSYFIGADWSAQREALMKALALVVVDSEHPRAEDDFKRFRTMFVNVAQSHTNNALRGKHWALFGRTLIQTLEEILGPEWRRETAQAWETAFAAAVSRMQQAEGVATAR